MVVTADEDEGDQSGPQIAQIGADSDIPDCCSNREACGICGICEICGPHDLSAGKRWIATRNARRQEKLLPVLNPEPCRLRQGFGVPRLATA